MAKGGNKKAGIGCLKSYVAGFTVINGGDIEASGGKEAAGITGEVVTINNGKVYAQGGWRSAGIGGSRQMDCRGDVTINGGVVEAEGGDGGSGIGGGEKGNLTATVTITGGTVNATGYNGGAGIGGGSDGGANKGHVIITGGTVTATSYNGGAGIGGGREGFYFEGGEGSNVTISGTAEVFANSGRDYSSAIGRGSYLRDAGKARNDGTLKLSDNMMVQASSLWYTSYDERDPAFTAAERVDACMHRWYAHVFP